MGNTNSYNKLLSRVKTNNIFEIYNFSDSLELNENKIKIIKKYKELYLVIDFDSISFFSKNLNLKNKIYLKDISSWKTNYNYSNMELLYDNYKVIKFGSVDIYNISQVIYKKTDDLSKINLNIINEHELNEESLNNDSINDESSEDDYLNFYEMPN